jgi:hypothetical protein
MAVIKKHSVAPIYTIAVVWVIFTLLHPLYRVSDYVSVILLSAVAFIVAKGIWPTVTYELPEPVETPKEETKADAAPEKEQDPKVAALIQEKDKALGEMRRLNEAISDETISKQIDQLEEITTKIVDYVAEKPEKLPQIRKFMNYYLPTTLKLLNAYDRMGTAGVSGENIDGTMGKIETMMETVVAAFQKQLDALFQDEAMDIASDITVMENLMAQEGLTDP